MNSIANTLLMQWSNASPIIRWGAIIGFCLLLSYPLAFIWDQRQIQQQAMADWLEKIEHVQQNSNQDLTTLQNQITTLDSQRLALEERFWTASEVGVVEVDIRNWLEGIISSFGFKNAKVNLEVSTLKKANDSYQYWIVMATINGQAKTEELLPLFRVLEEGQYIFEVGQAALTAQSFELVLNIPVLKGKGN